MYQAKSLLQRRKLAAYGLISLSVWLMQRLWAAAEAPMAFACQSLAGHLDHKSL